MFWQYYHGDRSINEVIRTIFQWYNTIISTLLCQIYHKIHTTLPRNHISRTSANSQGLRITYNFHRRSCSMLNYNIKCKSNQSVFGQASLHTNIEFGITTNRILKDYANCQTYRTWWQHESIDSPISCWWMRKRPSPDCTLTHHHTDQKLRGFHWVFFPVILSSCFYA